MSLPPQSPDVNPNKHFWERLEPEKVKHNPTSLNTLRDVINNWWKNIKTEVIRKLVDSMAELKHVKGKKWTYESGRTNCMLHFCTCTIGRILKKKYV